MSVKRNILTGMAFASVTALCGIVLATGVYAQSTAPEQASAVTKPGTMKMDASAPMCPMAMKMMADSDMPGGMKACMDMMKTPIYPDSPSAISGQADRLGLSDEQRTQLESIAKEARQKAVDILTPEQRETLGDVSEAPTSMVQLCQRMGGQMMSKMQQPTGNDQADAPMMACCSKMQGQSMKGKSAGSSSK